MSCNTYRETSWASAGGGCCWICPPPGKIKVENNYMENTKWIKKHVFILIAPSLFFFCGRLWETYCSELQCIVMLKCCWNKLLNRDLIVRFQFWILNFSGSCNTPQSFCSVSESLEHGPAGISARLGPVLDNVKKHHREVEIIHVFSDLPTTQYRQKGNLFMFAWAIHT